jgi:hypothetical protein
LELDVEDVDLARAGEIPAKAKPGDPITWGDLIITFASGEVLVALINFVQAWVTSRKGSVTVEIEGDKVVIPANPSREQQRAIDAWLRRHRGFEIANE